MRNITDLIERYLKNILQKSPEGMIEIQRNELADQFSCVPSQINYVISTRFSLEKGYLVESKRGGGGYIRIKKLTLPAHAELSTFIVETIGTSIDQSTAEGLIYQLKESGFLNEREGSMMKSAVSRDVLTLKLPIRDEVRAKVLLAMLVSLFSK